MPKILLSYRQCFAVLCKKKKNKKKLAELKIHRFFSLLVHAILSVKQFWIFLSNILYFASLFIFRLSNPQIYNQCLREFFQNDFFFHLNIVF